MYRNHSIPVTITMAAFCLIISGLSLRAQPAIRVVGGDTVDWGRVAPRKIQRKRSPVRLPCVVPAGLQTLVAVHSRRSIDYAALD